MDELNFGRDYSEGPRKTAISWTGATWNPMVGCRVLSPGCTNCYAMRTAHRVEKMGWSAAYEGTTQSVNGKRVWTGKVSRGSTKAIRKPLATRHPTVFFTCSMTDFFLPDHDPAWREEAWDVMRRCPQHIFQVLTKRPDVAQDWMATHRPLPNVWLGVSVERAQETWRITTLRETPAALRFLSVEPLLASLKMHGAMPSLAGVDWIITGGESGPGARPLNPEWIREVRDACIADGIPHFLKQFGSWASNPLVVEEGLSVEEARRLDLAPQEKGGATLDGRLWREMPEGVVLPD